MTPDQKQSSTLKYFSIPDQWRSDLFGPLVSGMSAKVEPKSKTGFSITPPSKFPDSDLATDPARGRWAAGHAFLCPRYFSRLWLNFGGRALLRAWSARQARCTRWTQPSMSKRVGSGMNATP